MPKKNNFVAEMTEKVNSYVREKGKPTSFMVCFSNRNTSDNIKCRNLSETLALIAESYDLGIECDEGEHIAYAKIGGLWHELCAREESGKLTANCYEFDQKDSREIQSIYRRAD